MKKMFFNIDNDILKMEGKILSFSSHSLLKEYKENIEELSGFMIIIDNKILLVKPKKFKGIKHKWSIPKGKIEGNDKFKSALKELEEETGIKLNNNIKLKTKKINIYYKKSNNLKKLTVYILRLNLNDLNVDLDHKWEVEKEHILGHEIYKAKFFTKDNALDKIEIGQMPLLKIM